MAPRQFVRLDDVSSSTAKHLLRLLVELRNIDLVPNTHNVTDTTTDQVPPRTIPATGILQQLHALSAILSSTHHPREAESLQDVYQLSTSPTDFGGLGFTPRQSLSAQEESEVLFLASAYLESLNSAERAKTPLSPLTARPAARRGMTLSEKIFAAHDVERRGEVRPGDVVRVDVDWILASELSWSGMERIYDQLGKPGIFRNDRFWLAGDHVVDPRIMDNPKIKPLVEASERAKRGFKMTENQGMNYTIMHTEFVRSRAQPGMLIIGSDSHTCSAGSVSSLAIGLGVADVTLPLITGETWFRIPESVNIRFLNNAPPPGIGGKDVILYILQQLRRNTVAADRVVEYTGPGLKYLSCDARFAIANMTTEFGGLSGIFVPDKVTKAYVEARKSPRYRGGLGTAYYTPDEDATYAATYEIDLAKVTSFVARYPSPDDVVPVTDGSVAGMELEGCFIGACTTTEEDLVLAALVLEEGLRRGLVPVKRGKRKMVPGSMPILAKLREEGLVDDYERAGFEVGVPGCSYCVGMAADKAGPGETWLSSQNRNFENRMGPGSFGNIASSVTVAASSFDMKITDPASLLEAVDFDRLHKILGQTPKSETGDSLPAPTYVEPGMAKPSAEDEGAEVETETADSSVTSTTEHHHTTATTSSSQQLDSNPDPALLSQTDPLAEPITLSPRQSRASSGLISGKTQLLGDFIDTDALAPNEALTIPNITPEELGTYCLRHTHPDFRRRVKEAGHDIVVAGEAFGCGSSRENAVTALQGAGVRCVIAKSFAFIYGRNQPNLGLLGFVVRDKRFWEVVGDGMGIRIDLDATRVEVEIEEGKWEAFGFDFSRMERRLIECGGVAEAFGKWGKGLWVKLREEGRPKVKGKVGAVDGQGTKQELQW